MAGLASAGGLPRTDVDRLMLYTDVWSGDLHVGWSIHLRTGLEGSARLFPGGQCFATSCCCAWVQGFRGDTNRMVVQRRANSEQRTARPWRR